MQEAQTKLVAYFSRIMGLSAEEAVAIAESSTIRSFKKGTVLLSEGQVSRACYFVLEGCVRQYYVVNGEEKTSHFFTEEQWVVSIRSFAEKVPADHYFACVEDTLLVVGTEEKENALYRQFPKFETLSRTVMGKIMAEQHQQLVTYVTASPEQRYADLLENRPDLIRRVPQYQLASYIGVAPESLSRIRKRLVLKS